MNADPATLLRSRSLRLTAPAWEAAHPGDIDPARTQRRTAQWYGRRLRAWPEPGQELTVRALALRDAVERTLHARLLPVDERLLASLETDVVTVRCVRAERRAVAYRPDHAVPAPPDALLDDDRVWVAFTLADGREVELCLCADDAGCERLNAVPHLIGPALAPAPSSAMAA